MDVIDSITQYTTDMATLFFVLGAIVVDAIEGWTLVLFALFIALDTYLGLWNRYMMLFNVLQILGLGLGYLWAMSVFQSQDVSGPYVWAFVIGVWLATTIVFNVLYVLVRHRTKDARL
jgi:hypothetical protein